MTLQNRRVSRLSAQSEAKITRRVVAATRVACSSSSLERRACSRRRVVCAPEAAASSQVACGFDCSPSPPPPLPTACRQNKAICDKNEPRHRRCRRQWFQRARDASPNETCRLSIATRSPPSTPPPPPRVVRRSFLGAGRVLSVPMKTTIKQPVVRDYEKDVVYLLQASRRRSSPSLTLRVFSGRAPAACRASALIV